MNSPYADTLIDLPGNQQPLEASFCYSYTAQIPGIEHL